MTDGLDEMQQVIMDGGHGSPATRGSADAYYGRRPNPHRWLDPLGSKQEELTDPKEIEEYLTAYRTEEDRKDWGE